MKVELKQVYQPVVITLETEEELKLFESVLSLNDKSWMAQDVGNRPDVQTSSRE